MRALGTGGLHVSDIGLGCYGMSGEYGSPNDSESIATIHHALDLGLNFIDTSDAYSAGKNEQLVGEALKGRRDKAILATKFGNVRGPNGERGFTNGRPEYVPVACDASLKRLGVDMIDLFYLHRIDADVPIEETVGAMARLIEAGKVRYLGICEAGANTIRRAHATHPLAALQTEYSLWSRDVEAEILPTVRELGIGFVAYSPLGRGFLTGAFRARTDLIEADRRHDHPRFKEGNFEQNLALLDIIEGVAERHGASASQVALAWLLSRGNEIVPIPGTKRRNFLDQNWGARTVKLDAGDIAALEAGFPLHAAAGGRYPKGQLDKLGL